MKKRIIFSIIGFVLFPIIATAQIGYQVSLLNSATGEPRANESVKVKIEITNSENKVICSEEKNATSNEFGVLSLSVGNSTTFDDVDWSKTPFYVSATIDDVLIGKSQILSVPIAEAAKTLIGLSPEMLSGTWKYDRIGKSSDNTFSYTLTFSFDSNSNTTGTAVSTYIHSGKGYPTTYSFLIEGNTIWLFEDIYVSILRYHNGLIYDEDKRVVFELK